MMINRRMTLSGFKYEDFYFSHLIIENMKQNSLCDINKKSNIP